LRVRAEFFEEDANGQGFSPPDLVRVLDTDTTRWQASGSYRWQLGDGENLTLSQNYGTYDHELRRFFELFPDTLQTTGFTDTLHDSKLAWELEGCELDLAAGVERNWDRLDSDRISSGVAEATQSGAYATSLWRVDEDWTLSAALRADNHEEFGTQLSPKLAATYRLDAQSTLDFGAGQGYRAPSLRERYYEFASPFGYTVIGNADLVPETSTSYTLDYTRQTRRGHFSLGGFSHDVDNLIAFTETQAVPQVFTTENVGHARSRGMQWSAERRWLVSGCDCPQCSCGRFFGLGWDGVWIGESEDTELGTRLANAPELDHSLRVFYASPEVRAEALLRSVGDRYLDRENTTQAPAYQTVDVNLSRTAGDGTWRLSGLNVLDEKDGRFGPEPGREVRLEYTLNF
jgi:outer membrane cobalamin receptor